MKIKDLDKLKKELEAMFKSKWFTTINPHIYNMIVEDVLKTVERHYERSS